MRQLMLYLQGLGVLAHLAHLAVGMQYVLVMETPSPASIPWFEVVGVMSVVTLVNIIPVTIAGLGVREGLAVLFLEKRGVSAGVAGVGAFVAFALDSGVLSLAGLAFSSRRGVGVQKAETAADGL